MRLTITSLLAVCLLAGLATEASAKKYKRGKAYRGYEVATAYPSASERQRQNSRAFDNGDYYESDYNAHAFGSRSWWMLQQGRGGGRR